MDGDSRPLHRRISVGRPVGDAWGYKATLGADIGFAAPATARTPEPTAQPARALASYDHRREIVSRPEPHLGHANAALSRKAWLYAALGVFVLLALVAAGILYWQYASKFESTDDAVIDADISQVSAQIAAKAVRIAVSDNQPVKAGQVLLQLDPRDFQVGVDRAHAQRAQAGAQLEQARAQRLLQQANLEQAQANIRVAQADLGQQQADLDRYRRVDPKVVSRQQLDISAAQTNSAAARLDASRQAAEAVKAQIQAEEAQIDAAAANLKAADVALANAQLQLSYTAVRAPQDGKVTNRSVNVGNYVQAGQALLAIVPDEFWVRANFKETQLAGMKAGQPVDIAVDACPGVDFKGRVDSFQSGSGSIFSSLPPENATGNYVKVVQRVPVKIVFDHVPPEDCRLAPGVSVVPSVTVR